MNPCTVLYYAIKHVFDQKVLDLSSQMRCLTTDPWVLSRTRQVEADQAQLQGDI